LSYGRSKGQGEDKSVKRETREKVNPNPKPVNNPFWRQVKSGWGLFRSKASAPRGNYEREENKLGR